jgi:hypothetical protein
MPLVLVLLMLYITAAVAALNHQAVPLVTPFGAVAVAEQILRIPLAEHLNTQERVALAALLELRVQERSPAAAVAALTPEPLGLAALVKSSSLSSQRKERT